MLLQENTIFDKRYQLIRLLGRGGFSEVWLAKDSYTKLDIAFKVYAPGQGMDSDGLAEFSAELAGVFNLNHTNLLKPTHVDAWEGMPYLIMPFCSRGSIVKQVGKMQEDEIWKLIHDVASGLAYLHKNDIVHQDIKPDNILLDDNGNYVITDLGISTKARSTLRKSVIGGAVSGGTMAYMGPERFSKQPAPTKASDIWSFGAMVYELITGNVPFGEMGGGMQKGGAEIPEINEPISDTLRQTIESMLALETWDRPTAEQLVQTTADYADNLPTSRTTQRMVTPAQTEPAAGESSTGGKKIGLVKIFAWVIVSILCVLVPIAAYYLYNNTPASYNNTPTSYQEEPSVHTFEIPKVVSITTAEEIPAGDISTISSSAFPSASGYSLKADVYYRVTFEVNSSLPVYSSENCVGSPSFYLYKGNEFVVLNSRKILYSAQLLTITKVYGNAFPDCTDNGYSVGDKLYILESINDGYNLVLNNKREEYACFSIQGDKAITRYDGCNMIEGDISGYEKSVVTMHIKTTKGGLGSGYVRFVYDYKEKKSDWGAVTTWWNKDYNN